MAREAEQDAARNREVDYVEQWRYRYDEELGPPPASPNAIHEWAARAAAMLCEESIKDFALPPEQRRRLAIDALRKLSDILDPAKMAAQIGELEAALAELKGLTSNAGAIARREAGTA